MQIQRKRRKKLLHLHRWIGIACSLFLLILSLTGLALNHTEKLGLDRIQIQSEFLLKHYNIEAKDPLLSYELKDDLYVSLLGQQIFFNNQFIAEIDALVGVLCHQDIIFLAGKGELLLCTENGEIIEKLNEPILPDGEIQSLGLTRSNFPGVLINDNTYVFDEYFTDLQSSHMSLQPSVLRPKLLPEVYRTDIFKLYRGEGLSLYRVLLDIHAGRFLGKTGVFLMDLTAIAIIYLLISGIWVSLAKKSKNRG